jgi:hypothetical protein
MKQKKYSIMNPNIIEASLNSKKRQRSLPFRGKMPRANLENSP